ncbi:MAG: ATP-dependent Clp protease ATP-binding subunit clpA-like protein [uncultured bacterium]|nr:MAG: ATP-dependent Clp protease ATP-binding subunit clpA-like protein [uncultured bacterium]
MFERFTEKAIKIVTYAQEEALNAKHSKLYPEHILLGILREGTGIAARFLKASGLNLETLREKVDEIVVMKQQGNLSAENLPFSSATKKILKEAWDEAKSLGANYINTEHLFLSLLKDKNSSVTKLLDELDINKDRIKDSVIRVIERKAKIALHPEACNRVFSPKSRFFSIPSIFEETDSNQIMTAAQEKLKNTNLEALGTEQIFLAILEDKESILSTTLENEGITAASFQEKLNSLQSREAEYNQNECLFTPGAFFAINSAYELAKELGSSSIKPEHLILGLLKEKKGIAYELLKEMNINTENLYNKIINPIERQKPVTLTILRLAKEEARRLGHNMVGTEQILLGILGEGMGIGAIVLKNLGITLKDARIETEKLVGYGNEYSETELTFTPRVKKLLEIAWSKAKKFNHPRIESEHLLLGIIKEKECMAMKVLENFGVDVLEIKQGILKAIEEKSYNSSIEEL